MSRPPRIHGFSYIGLHRYFLTICTMNRAALFTDDAIARSTIGQFLLTAAHERFALAAYCLMPNHIHVLAEGTDDRADLRRFVKLSKQRSGSIFSRAHGSRLWQEGYFDRVLRKEEDSITIAKYIIENPVRAGLVKEATDYRYVGSSIWTVRELFEGITA